MGELACEEESSFFSTLDLQDLTWDGVPGSVYHTLRCRTSRREQREGSSVRIAWFARKMLLVFALD